MKSYQNILVTLDGSELAEAVLEHISDVAAPGALIHLLSVVGSISVESSLGGRDLLTAPMNGNLYNSLGLPNAPTLTMHQSADPEAYRQRLEYVQSTATKLREEGYRVLVDVQPGKVVDTIVRTAQNNNDLILMATHGRTGMSRVILGSVAEAVLRKTSCPVMLVPAPHDHALLKKAPHSPYILVCLDGSPEAEAILPEVEKLLSMHPAKVVLLRVGQPVNRGNGVLNSGLFAPGLPMPDDEREVLSSGTERAIRAYLDGVAAQLEAVGATPVVEVGFCKPTEDILFFSRYYGASLIAMATHGWAGLDRLVRGSVTETVLEHAPCPVLVVHRDLQQ